MNGIESVGGVGSADQMSRVPNLPKVEPALGKDGHSPRTSAGMAGALELSGEFLKQTMSEIGFVDIHAGGRDKIKAFVAHESAQEQEPEVSFDSVTAMEIAKVVGAQEAGETGLALRIQSEVDPARAAALLR